MARSDHASYTAADRYERRASKRPRPLFRRQSTRRAIIALAIREA